MKNSILLFTLLFISIAAFAQKGVITIKGDTIRNEVSGLYGKNLAFKGSNTQLNIADVKEIFGKTPQSRLNLMLRHNPNIKVHAELPVAGKTTQQTVSTSRTQVQEYSADRHIFSPSASTPKITNLHPTGIHLKNAGAFYLTATGIGIAGIIVLKVNVKEQSKALNNTAIALGVAAGVSSIIGHVKLVQAGKSFNKESITLGPAENGLGLSINF